MNELLTKVSLPRSTYYERLSKTYKTDKYAQLKEFIVKTYHDSNSTYGYRRIWKESLKVGFKNSPETIRHLMTKLKLKVVIFSKHTSGYCSYKGNLGKIAPSTIKQKFTETEPLKVLHTDVTQIRLHKDKWGYISAVLDQASGKILSYSISLSPNKLLILDTLEKLKQNIVPSLKPILHSDQGWHYQLKYYRDTLKTMGIEQSMSRKGNCHDNAPIESFFNLLKRECLYRYNIDDLTELKNLVAKYINWYNNKRISLKKNGLSLVEYREQSMIF